MCIYMYVPGCPVPMQKKRILICVVEVLCVVANSTIGCRNMSKFGRLIKWWSHTFLLMAFLNLKVVPKMRTCMPIIHYNTNTQAQVYMLRLLCPKLGGRGDLPLSLDVWGALAPIAPLLCLCQQKKTTQTHKSILGNVKMTNL